MTLSKNFLWGGATSAAQIEGSFNVCGRGFTQLDYLTLGSSRRPRMITCLNNDKKEYVPCFFEIPKGYRRELFDNEYYPNHDAIDFYKRYVDDIKLFAEMGFKTFRMSISWSRIFPKGIEDEANYEAIEFYKNVFKELKKYGIEPLVTLWHFDTPLYLVTEYHDWYNRDLIDYFEKYAKVCFSEFKGLVKYWITFNEINNPINLLKINNDPNKYENTFQYIHNQLVASARAVIAGHNEDSNNMIGCMISGITYYPDTCDPKDIIETLHKNEESLFYCGDVQVFGKYSPYTKRIWSKYNVELNITEQDRKDLSEGKVDMYTFSYYLSANVTTHNSKEEISGNMSFGVKNDYLKYTDWGWATDSLGLQYYLERMYDRYKIPMFIVENGLGATDAIESDMSIHDDYRINYIKEHIKAFKNAVDNGVDLIGYTVWGCIDLVSASTGEMSKRYGLIYVDKNDDGSGTLNRYKKDSFYWYKKVIESNGEDLD